MNKQLTEEQIQRLHGFCEKHYVPYYDLQVELVDHLASAIENRWETQPETTFDRALIEVFSEFGNTGFSKVRMERHKHLMKKYQGMLWQYLGQFFRLPKIILTITLAVFLIIIFRSTEKDSLIVFLYLVSILVFELIFYSYIYPKYYSIRKLTKKKFIMADIFRNVQGGFAIIPVIFFNFLGFLGDHRSLNFPVWLEILASILLVSFTFLIISFSFYIPGKIREHFIKQFSQFAKS